ncbi:hypothetical protein RJ639_018192 [Escallonia herrerae]|uniref:non-specific serine/threonine protein kinase n=1 Tax=Escallonia herrerae TaxID=1293975 RepID=A0AA88V7X8_9ASTE|nr:hypothetical protein RJ639_018192 [Escallonia herrerae]
MVVDWLVALAVATVMKEKLFLNNNSLTGEIPAKLTGCSNLISSVAHRNKLPGNIPVELASLSKLGHFSAELNNLTGSIPLSFGNLSSLVHLSIGKISLTRSIPGTLGQLRTLPESFSNLSSNLAFLYLDNNPISGGIPAGIGNLVNLKYLAMWNTQLSKLKDLILSHSQLSGVIPSTIGNLSSLIELYLDGNNFDGNIPSTLGNCTNLLLLNLSQNSLSGRIPQQLFGLSSLSILLDLSQNHLSGTLPSEIGESTNLGYLDVSNNKLQGNIPTGLANCLRLENLFMEGNLFQGIIPSLFSSLKGLLYLDLSRNNLSGPVPAYFGEIDLQYLNLSYNNFEGVVPTKGIFINASATSVIGNIKLCGGITDLHLPLCKAKLSEKSKSGVRLKFIIFTAFGLLGMTILCILLLLFCFRKRKHPTLHSPKGSILRLSYQSHKSHRSFGSVYRGIIDDGKLVAVKVLNLQHRGASKSFMAECEALKITRHRNLVKVLTACSSVDNQETAVVYEFMGNRSLDEWLHPVTSEDAEPRHLNLLKRLNIIIDVACAVEYLHNYCQPHIVHCDIKPSNILLDNEFTGHVGDFGLARLFEERACNLSANQKSSIGVKGSIGYTPPDAMAACAEYGMGSKVSVHGDVYCFGILLLEMFTKKRPTDDMFSGNMNLHNFAKTAFSEGLLGIADPTLLQEGEEGETSTGTSIAHTQPVVCREEIHDCMTSVCKSHSNVERVEY